MTAPPIWVWQGVVCSTCGNVLYARPGHIDAVTGQVTVQCPICDWTATLQLPAATLVPIETVEIP